MRLRNLMNDMEQVYSIPMRRNKMFEQLNARVMHLYWSASRARDFEWEGVR